MIDPSSLPSPNASHILNTKCIRPKRQTIISVARQASVINQTIQQSRERTHRKRHWAARKIATPFSSVDDQSALAAPTTRTAIPDADARCGTFFTNAQRTRHFIKFHSNLPLPTVLRHLNRCARAHVEQQTDPRSHNIKQPFSQANRTSGYFLPRTSRSRFDRLMCATYSCTGTVLFPAVSPQRHTPVTRCRAHAHHRSFDRAVFSGIWAVGGR